MAIVQLSAEENAITNEFKQRLVARFGDRLAGVRLYGSTARGERWQESDIDILVLIDQLSWEEKRWVWDSATLLNIHHDTQLSPLVMTPADMQALRDRELRIAQDIDREGIPL